MKCENCNAKEGELHKADCIYSTCIICKARAYNYPGREKVPERLWNLTYCEKCFDMIFKMVIKGLEFRKNKGGDK